MSSGNVLFVLQGESKAEKDQPQNLCISMNFTHLNKLGLQSNILLSLDYIIVKLLKTTKKIKTGLLFYAYLLFVLIN